MIKKVSRLLFIYTSFIFSSAAFAASTPILKNGSYQIAISLAQNGLRYDLNKVPQRYLLLKPDNFEIRFTGDTEKVSYFAVKDEKIIQKLQKLKNPLLSFHGTAGSNEPNNLHIKTDELLIYKKLKNYSSNKIEDSKIEDKIKKIFSSKKISFFNDVHFYEHLKNPKHQNTQSLWVKTIDEKPIQEGEHFILIVLLEKPLIEDFYEVKWVEIPLVFSNNRDYCPFKK